MSIRIPILLYHHIVPRRTKGFNSYCVSAEKFAEQMTWLKRRAYRTIDLNRLLECLQSGEAIPENSVIITFDDGYENNFEYAFPILKSLGFQATIFLLSEYIDTDRDIHGFRFLNTQQIHEMMDVGFSFESHGKIHDPLTTLGDNEVLGSLIHSRQVINKKLKKDISFFAYPFGLFDDRIKGMVEQAGYLGACGGTPGLYATVDDPFALGRIEIFESDSPYRFAFKMKTGFNYFYYLLKLGGRIKSAIW